MVGKFCGWQTGLDVFLSGDCVVMKFHSDNTIPARGFLIHFTAVPLVHGKYNQNIISTVEVS